jgi:hypothetical protein
LSRIGGDTVRTPAAVLQIEEAGVEIRSYLSDESSDVSIVVAKFVAIERVISGYRGVI